MSREVAFAGVCVPSLLLAFIFMVPIYMMLDATLARYGAYRWVWHVDLFRICLFIVMFAALGNMLYR